jgi:Arc/MetJ-type ribon-helix-helix transcriptional regulator
MTSATDSANSRRRHEHERPRRGQDRERTGGVEASIYHPYSWCWDDEQMVADKVLSRGKAERDKSEKITINIGLVDLGEIDLLVDEGFFANRTDFIRTAIRRQLESRSSAVDRTVSRRELTIGSAYYSRRDLEQVRASGTTVQLRVLGLATIADDVSPELALGTIDAVEVLGAFRAPEAVKAALAPRTT